VANVLPIPVSWPSWLIGESLDWSRLGREWPHHQASRFVRAAGLRWHVQEFGRGPALLLVHGTAASGHSWRDLVEPLSQHFRVIVPDLPGHGFSAQPAASQMSLPAMARALSALLGVLGHRPVAAVGHSAGAAILCRMSLDSLLDATCLISLNGSLLSFRGPLRRLYPPMAKLLTWSPVLPRILARRARDGAVVASLLRDTGSRLDAQGMRLYRILARSPQHVAAALAMMAHWDLDALEGDLPKLAPRLTLVVGQNDRFVEPESADGVERIVANAQVLRLPQLGHLAHEESPAQVAGLIVELTEPERLGGWKGRGLLDVQ